MWYSMSCWVRKGMKVLNSPPLSIWSLNIGCPNSFLTRVEFSKSWKCIRFRLQKVNPCITIIDIHETNVISKAISRKIVCKTPKIRNNKLQRGRIYYIWSKKRKRVIFTKSTCFTKVQFLYMHRWMFKQLKNGFDNNKMRMA